MNELYLIKIILLFVIVGIIMIFIEKTKLIWINLFKLIKILLNITIPVLWKTCTYNFIAECLAYKLSISQEFKYKDLFTKIFILLLILGLSIFSLRTGIKLNNAQSNSFYIFSGSLLGIFATLLVDNIKNIMERKDTLITMCSFLEEEFRILQSIYESFLLEFPFDDKFFSDGDNIIYITPVNTPDCEAYLDEKKAFRFIEHYKKMLDENKLIDIFYPDKIDKFVSLIYQNRLSLNEVQSKSFSLSKFQNKNNIIFLEQLCNKINSLFDYINIYKNWNNSNETKKELIQIYSILVYKLIHTIACVQKCLKEYEKYVKHCTKPLNLYPQLKLEEIIRLNKYDGMKLKDIINEEKQYLE